MPIDTTLTPDECNCLAVRSAARHVTQFYDELLAPTGLRTTQFSPGEINHDKTDHRR
jgi:hypothetical protein